MRKLTGLACLLAACGGNPGNDTPDAGQPPSWVEPHVRACVRNDFPEINPLHVAVDLMPAQSGQVDAMATCATEVGSYLLLWDVACTVTLDASGYCDCEAVDGSQRWECL